MSDNNDIIDEEFFESFRDKSPKSRSFKEDLDQTSSEEALLEQVQAEKAKTLTEEELQKEQDEAVKQARAHMDTAVDGSHPPNPLGENPAEEGDTQGDPPNLSPRTGMEPEAEKAPAPPRPSPGPALDPMADLREKFEQLKKLNDENELRRKQSEDRLQEERRQKEKIAEELRRKEAAEKILAEELRRNKAAEEQKDLMHLEELRKNKQNCEETVQSTKKQARQEKLEEMANLHEQLAGGLTDIIQTSLRKKNIRNSVTLK